MVRKSIPLKRMDLDARLRLSALPRAKRSIPIPEIVEEGEIAGYYYLITTQLEGDIITRSEWLGLDGRQQTGLIQELGSGLKELHSHDTARFEF